MKTKPTYNLLTTNLFLLGLTLLLLNDFYLKYQYPSFLTGKLSDFSGLFIFPFFISVFLPRPKSIYFMTAVFFTFWKLEYSQSFIDTLANLTNLGFHRTVDPSDLIALSVLPISYMYFMQKSNAKTKDKFGVSIVVSLIALFSFCATTLPRQEFKSRIKTDKSFVIEISKEKLFSKINARCVYSDTLSRNMTDSLFYLFFTIPDYNAEVTAIAKIKSLGPNLSLVQLDSITEYNIMGRLFFGIKQSHIDACKIMTAINYEHYFEKNFVDIIKNSRSEKTDIYFDNKELLDEINKNINNYR